MRCLTASPGPVLVRERCVRASARRANRPGESPLILGPRGSPSPGQQPGGGLILPGRPGAPPGGGPGRIVLPGDKFGGGGGLGGAGGIAGAEPGSGPGGDRPLPNRYRPPPGFMGGDAAAPAAAADAATAGMSDTEMISKLRARAGHWFQLAKLIPAMAAKGYDSNALDEVRSLGRGGAPRQGPGAGARPCRSPPPGLTTPARATRAPAPSAACGPPLPAPCRSVAARKRRAQLEAVGPSACRRAALKAVGTGPLPGLAPAPPVGPAHTPRPAPPRPIPPRPAPPRPQVTGITPAEQNLWVVAATVYDSLTAAAAAGAARPELLRHFEGGGDRLLYHFRFLPAQRRVDAAEYIAANGLEPPVRKGPGAGEGRGGGTRRGRPAPRAWSGQCGGGCGCWAAGRDGSSAAAADAPGRAAVRLAPRTLGSGRGGRAGFSREVCGRWQAARASRRAPREPSP
jgi:hypothetical protein